MLALWWQKKMCNVHVSVTWQYRKGKRKCSTRLFEKKKRLTVNYVRVLKLSTLCKYKSLDWRVQHNAGGGIKSPSLAMGLKTRTFSLSTFVLLYDSLPSTNVFKTCDWLKSSVNFKVSFWCLEFFQKTNKKIRLTVLSYLKLNCFRSFFGRIEDTKRDISKLTDL